MNNATVQGKELPFLSSVSYSATYYKKPVNFLFCLHYAVRMKAAITDRF